MVYERSIAFRALTRIPINNAITAGASPFLFLLCNPTFYAGLLLTSDIFQDLTMVGTTIIIEVDNPLTGKIRALGAVR